MPVARRRQLEKSETRQYNALKQLTSIATSGPGPNVNFSHSFSSTQNNGKITQMQDIATGETIQYAYDSLLRLSSATSNQSWSQGFVYDGFGNLTNVNAANAPGLAVNVNPATNQLYSDVLRRQRQRYLVRELRYREPADRGQRSAIRLHARRQAHFQAHAQRLAGILLLDPQRAAAGDLHAGYLRRPLHHQHQRLFRRPIASSRRQPNHVG
jgi:YD repeat-containing protein